MNALCDPIVEQAFFQAGDREIEARLHYPPQGRPALAALIAPPHPFLGGNFDNNVVAHLAREFASRGWLAVTYNLPGVGGSMPRTGTATRQSFWEDPAIGEEGAADARDFALLAARVQSDFGIAQARMLPVGYSYGGAVALLAPLAPLPPARILISPPLPQLPPGAFEGAQPPTFAVFGSDDIAADSDAIGALRSREIAGLDIAIIPGAGHFYLDELSELTSQCIRFLERAAPAFAN